MKTTKIENVSSMKLDFFLIQNKEDVRIVLEPGEYSWCDHETTTKSMILYERKNLIKISEEDYIDANNDEILDKSHTTEDIRFVALDLIPVQPLSPPDGTGLLSAMDFIVASPEMTSGNALSNLHTTEDIESKEKPEKKYSGKKRGRKKKRGPKPGSKRNKGNNPAE